MRAGPPGHHVHSAERRPCPKHLLANGPASSVGEKIGRNPTPTSTPVLTSAPTLRLLSCDKVPAVRVPTPLPLGASRSPSPPPHPHGHSPALSTRWFPSCTVSTTPTSTPSESHPPPHAIPQSGTSEPRGRRPPAALHLGHTRDAARVLTSSDLRVARASGCFCYLPCPPLAIPRPLAFLTRLLLLATRELL